MCLNNFETNLNVVGQLLKDSNIVKLTDFIKCKYPMFIRNSLSKKNVPIFNEFYFFFNQNHVYNTRGSTNQIIVAPQIQTTYYGKHSFKSRSINVWNLCQRNLKTDLITCDFAIKTKKNPKLYGPFLWMGFNCFKGRATPRRQFTFYH